MATVTVSIPTDYDVDRLESSPDQIMVRPVFYGRGKESDPCLHLQVKDDEGNLVARYVLCVNGRNLTLELKDRTRGVIPLIDQMHLKKNEMAQPDSAST